MRTGVILRAILLAAAVVGSGASRGQDAVPAEAIEFFEKSVRPLLADRCYSCHSSGAGRIRGGLTLDSRPGVLDGGEQGPAAVPGAPDESLIIEAVRYTDPLLRMPPDAKLDAAEIEALEAWVRLGLPMPEDGQAPAARPGRGEDLSPPDADWWSFRPVASPTPPEVADPSWPRNPVDRFILARLEAEGMEPAPPADARTLIRRVTFDLTGLPPTPEEVEAFLDDDRPDAYERLVDRLLASHAFGERWGRHWLDVVRYADTSGCNGDVPMPEAYRYRNHVIDRLNADWPYDRFVREQVAGDLLPAASDEERHAQIVATGYLAISRRFSSVAEEFHLTLDDAIDNLGKAVLGLSVSCARCHDHKFDPIPQSDYFALYGILESSKFAFPGTEIYRHPQDLVPLEPRDRVEGELAPFLAKMAALDAEILATYATIEDLDTGDEKERLRGIWERLKKERDELVRAMPEADWAYAVSEGTPADARIQLRGDPEDLGPAVPRGFLTALGGQKVDPSASGSGRLELAGWLTDPANPLTARVIVNRVWQGHFGQGIVRTPNDFGIRGDPPTHPELLDFLASRFVADGWSLKALHRTIVTSQTYRMAGVDRDDFAVRDPQNRMLWSFPRRRLQAEELRDAILAVSGALDRSMGGPHPFPPVWEWRYTQHHPFVDDYETARRGIYLMQPRIRMQPFLGTFDGADANASTDQRRVSTTPQQALFLLNDAFVHDQAACLADRLAGEAEAPDDRIARAFLLAFARRPSAEEVDEGLAYLDRVRPALAVAGVPEADRGRAAWASYLRVLLSSNEFVFLD